jgi:hypothetical protein
MLSVVIGCWSAVNQTCGFLTGRSSRGLMRSPLPFGVKKLGKTIKVKFGDEATSFFIIAAMGQWLRFSPMLRPGRLD